MKSKLLITGGVFAFTAAAIFTGCQQASAPQKTPEQVVKDAVKNLSSVTANQFGIALNGDLTGPQGQAPAKVKFNLTLDGGSDLKDLKDPKINLKLDGSGNADDQNGSLSAELRMNKDNLYFTLAKLDLQGGPTLPADLKNMYVGKWWKLPIPPDTLKEFAANLPEGGSQQNLSPEQQKLKDMVQNAQFFTNIKFVNNEDVKGMQSYHYSADIDKKALVSFVEQSAVVQGQTMSDSDKKDMEDAMQKFDITANLWVDSATGNLDQVSCDLKFVHPGPSDPTGTISAKATLWAFNQPVTVQVPADAQLFPIDQLLGGLMGASGNMGALDNASMTEGN